MFPAFCLFAFLASSHWLWWIPVVLFGTAFFTNPTLFPFGPKASASKIHDLGGFDFKMIQVTGPTLYPNPGGIVVQPSLFGLQSLEWWMPVCSSNGAHDLSMDTTGNIHVFVSSTGAEVANNTDLSGEKIFLLGAGLR